MPEPTDTKSFTLRLPAPLADELATVAEVDGVPVQQAVRDAIAGLAAEILTPDGK